jgi:hypothetical protein
MGFFLSVFIPIRNGPGSEHAIPSNGIHGQARSQCPSLGALTYVDVVPSRRPRFSPSPLASGFVLPEDSTPHLRRLARGVAVTPSHARAPFVARPQATAMYVCCSLAINTRAAFLACMHVATTTYYTPLFSARA